MTTIVLTTFNRSHLLKWQFQSIHTQEILNDYNILVLDEGDDNTDIVCHEWSNKLPIQYFKTSTFKLNKNDWRQPGYAFNFGVKNMTESEFIILGCGEIFHIGNTIDDIINILHSSPKGLSYTKGYDDDGTVLNQLENNKDIIYNHLPNLQTLHPFFLGLKRSIFLDIGGYDEDLSGVGFDDLDIISRLWDYGCEHIKTKGEIIHLYHDRSGHGLNIEKIKYNQNIFNSRRGQIIRNEGKNWGNF